MSLPMSPPTPRSLRLRDALAKWLLAVLTISITGCHASPPPAAPSPFSLAGSTPVSVDASVVSPDFGTLAVSVRPDALWLLVGDGAPSLLTQGTYPRLSPDGCSVLFLRTYPEYWIANTSDARPRRLLPPADGGPRFVYGLSWSPDAKGFAVTHGGDIKRVYAGDLWWVDASSGTLTLIAPGGAGEPHFSPDGQWIATSLPYTGWNQGAVGLWRVEDQSGQTLFNLLLQQYLQWADDSSGFAVALLGIGDPGLELWWVPVDGVPVQLGRLSDAIYAAWQPGTERLVYYAPKVIEDPERDQAYSLHSLHLVNRDGSGDEVVPGSEGMTFWNKWALDLSDASPWSPDGRWLLTVDQDGNTYIVDTRRLHVPLPLSVGRVHGWLDATHYLASTYRLGDTELYRCAPPEDCHSLARMAGEIQGLSYTDKRCDR